MKVTTYKHLLSCMMVLLFSLALAGCRGVASENQPPLASSGAFKVAMLLPGPIDDQAWSQAGYEGLKLIENELGAEVIYTAKTDGMSESELREIFRQYATQGVDFIIAHGGEYISAAKIVAEEFPHTNFAVMASYAGNNKNLGALIFRGEMGYLTGVVAALKTKSNKVAYIGGQPYAHIQEHAILFERGAKATNPQIEVSVEWVESWTDFETTRQISQAQIESGADVLSVSVDQASQAGFEVAERAGVYAIGWSVDQHELAPQTILTSAIQRVPVLLLEGATLVQLDRWEGKQYKFGLREGAQELAPFYGLLTPEEEETVNAVKQDILTGKIDLDQLLAP
jgi:basic membrane lipoprotein Med (substrate-binding protein (PBP1-ABC) superfamily)